MKLQDINQGFFDVLKEHAPGARYVIVIWETGETHASIASNEIDEARVVKMLSGAARIIGEAGPADYLQTGIGHA